MRSTHLIAVVLAILSMTSASADDTPSAEDDLGAVDRVNGIVTGLRNIDASIQQIQNKGFASWFTDQAGSYAQQHFPSLFGPASGMVKDVQTAGANFYDIGSRGLAVLNQDAQAVSGTSEETQKAIAANNQFTDSFLPEQAQSMGSYLLQKAVPESVQQVYDAVASRVETFCENAEWLQDRIGAAIDAGEVTANEITKQIKNYIASGLTDGLEPNGRDEQELQNSQQPLEQVESESSIIAQVTQTEDTSTNSESTGTTASAPSGDSTIEPEGGSATRGMAGDLQKAGLEPSQGSKNPATITPDELNALTASATAQPSTAVAAAEVEEPSPSSTASADASQLESNLPPAAEDAQRRGEADELNQQAAADEAARAAKEAEDRTRKESARAEAQRQRQALARQQQENQPIWPATRQPQHAAASTDATPVVLELYGSTNDGVWPLIGRTQAEVQSYVASMSTGLNLSQISHRLSCDGIQWWAYVVSGAGEQQGFGLRCGEPSRDAAITDAYRGYIKGGGGLSDGLAIVYGYVRPGLRLLQSFDYAEPRGDTGRAPACRVALIANPLRVGRESWMLQDDDGAEACGDHDSILQLITR